MQVAPSASTYAPAPGDLVSQTPAGSAHLFADPYQAPYQDPQQDPQQDPTGAFADSSPGGSGDTGSQAQPDPYADTALASTSLFAPTDHTPSGTLAQMVQAQTKPLLITAENASGLGIDFTHTKPLTVSNDPAAGFASDFLGEVLGEELQGAQAKEPSQSQDPSQTANGAGDKPSNDWVRNLGTTEVDAQALGLRPGQAGQGLQISGDALSNWSDETGDAGYDQLVDAFGNALRQSLAAVTAQTSGSGYGLQPSTAAVGNWSFEVASGVSVAAARQNAAEVALSMGRAMASEAGGSDGGSPSFLDSVRAASGRDDLEYDDGSDWSMQQAGGARSGSVRYKPGSIVQLARNEGRDGVVNGLDDITGFVGMMNDYRVLGSALQLQTQAKQNLAELADIRKDLIELGKKPPLEAPELMAPEDGPRVLAEKLTEHRNYVRLVVLERAGQLTLNDDLSIRDIGKDRLSPEEFATQLRRAYEGGVARGANAADGLAQNGQLTVNPFLALKVGDAAAEQIAKGNIVDGFAKGSAKLFLDKQGLFEGGLVSINRRFYSDTGQVDLYRIPDVLVNYGPRNVLALDATLGTKTAATPQVRDAFKYGVTEWGSVTRYGTQWISNPAGVPPRIQWRGK